MKPTIGRIVRYVDGNHQEWPAIITVVHNDTLVDLQVFRQSDIIPATSVPLAQPAVPDVQGGDDPADAYFTGSANSWHWPARA